MRTSLRCSAIARLYTNAWWPSGGVNPHAGTPGAQQELGVEEPTPIEPGRDQPASHVGAQRLESATNQALAVTRHHRRDQLPHPHNVDVPAALDHTNAARLALHLTRPQRTPS